MREIRISQLPTFMQDPLDVVALMICLQWPSENIILS